MKIFMPMPMEDYECVNCLDPTDYEVFATFDGSSRAHNWTPIRVRLVRAYRRRAFKRSDFPWLGGHVLVMRGGSVVALRDILDAHGELLPIETDDGTELFAFNARTVDALDEAHSSVVRFPGTDRIMAIEKLAFSASQLDGVDIFRMPHRGSSTYVSERFVNRVAAAGLVGLEFDLAWAAG